MAIHLIKLKYFDYKKYDRVKVKNSNFTKNIYTKVCGSLGLLMSGGTVYFCLLKLNNQYKETTFFNLF